MAKSLTPSGTFFVGSERQQKTLEGFQRREDRVSEEYVKSKPLSFNAAAFQQTHAAKLQRGHPDADATHASSALVGVCDGVSQLAEFGLDPALLPRELLDNCGRLAQEQLGPSGGKYKGPIALLKEAYNATTSLGSTTVLFAAIDNTTRIHGKLHSMVAVLSIGDCELLMLRRADGAGKLEAIFRTEMQRIDQNTRTPLQLSRVTQNIDPHFNEGMALETIEEGSAVFCVSALEGDVLVLGSDGVFDNLFLDEIVRICNDMLGANVSMPLTQDELAAVSRRIVQEAHRKTVGADAPIGVGGKADDTSVVVAEVVAARSASQASQPSARRRSRQDSIGCIRCEAEEDSPLTVTNLRKVKVRSKSADDSDTESDTEDAHCVVA